MNKLESACYLAEGDEAPFDKLHEECGVFGIYRADSANKSVVAETYPCAVCLAAPRSGELRHCRQR